MLGLSLSNMIAKWKPCDADDKCVAFLAICVLAYFIVWCWGSVKVFGEFSLITTQQAKTSKTDWFMRTQGVLYV